MHDVSRIIVWCIIQATIFGLVASVVYLAARRIGPRVGASVALAALLGFGFLTLVALSPWPRWEIRPLLSHRNPTQDVADERIDQRARTSAAVAEEFPETNTGIDSEIGSVPSAAEVFFGAFSDTIRATDTMAARQQVWSNRIGLLFAGGLGLCVAWRAIGLLALRRQVRQSRCLEDNSLIEEVDVLCAELGLTRRVEIRQSAQLATAATVGSRRPVILLPATWRAWSPEERRVVLAHELAHIARHDYSTWILAQIGVLTHFYHPLVHWLASRLRLEQELAADALAASLSGGQQKYLTTLAQLALRSSAPSIVWPAQAFLPTRSMFLRRIEMLRNPQVTREHRWATATTGLSLATLLAVAIFICGVRLPGPATALAQVVDSTSSDTGEDRASADDFDWRSIADKAFLVAVVRPSHILDSEKMKPMMRKLNQILEQTGKASGIKVEQVDEAWVFVDGRSEPLTVIRTKVPVRADETVFQLLKNPQQVAHKERSYYVDAAKRWAIMVLDARTFVFGTNEAIRETIEKLETEIQSTAWMADFQNSRDGDATVFVNASRLAKANGELPPNPAMQMFAHLLKDVDYAVLRANLVGKTQVSATVSAVSSEAAERTAATLQAAFVLGQNLVRMQSNKLANTNEVPEEAREPLKQVFAMANVLLGNAKATADGKNVKFVATADEGGDTAVVMAILLPAIHAAREAARRTQSMNNLKQVGLAITNYQSTYGSFPPPVILGPDGKTPHSWRVAVLPFIDKQELYERYRLDEPWDSADNVKLLDEMPSIFRSPSDREESQSASYFALTGKETVLGTSQPKSHDKGTRVKEIRDGLSKTIMLVEAKNEVPWTKPVDIEIVAEQPLPDLGGWHPNIFLASFADVAIRIFTKDAEKDTIRKLTTKAGGESVELN